MKNFGLKRFGLISRSLQTEVSLDMKSITRISLPNGISGLDGLVSLPCLPLPLLLV